MLTAALHSVILLVAEWRGRQARTFDGIVKAKSYIDMGIKATIKQCSLLLDRSSGNYPSIQLTLSGTLGISELAAEKCLDAAFGESRPSSEVPVKDRAGDLFFHGACVYYYRFIRQFALRAQDELWRVEAGILHDAELDGEREIQKFCDLVGKSLEKLFSDAQRARAQRLDWSDVHWPSDSEAFADAVGKLQGKDGPCAGYPVPPSGAEAALEALWEPELRQLAMRVKTGKPIFMPRPDEGNDVTKAMGELAAAGLAVRRNLIVCRRFNDKQLLVVPDGGANVADALCPHCRRPLSEELALEGFVGTDLCDVLLNKSEWLTHVVCATLRDAGIQAGNVLVNQPLGDEELDLFVHLFGSLCIIELKDRVFSLSDARSLIDRCLRFKADHVVAISTSSIAPEARSRIEEFGEEGIPGGRKPSVTFVEGLDQIAPRLEALIGQANVQALGEVVGPLDIQIPFDAFRLVAAKLSLPAPAARRHRRRSRLVNAVRAS